MMKPPIVIKGILIDDTPASDAEWDQMLMHALRAQKTDGAEALEQRAVLEREFGDLSRISKEVWPGLYVLYRDHVDWSYL
ncbi:MAG: hypothetical protein AAFS01_05535, partial [Pseudomonadota bacterium]